MDGFTVLHQSRTWLVKWPTGVLTFHATGLGLVSARGKMWAMAPQPGDLEIVEAEVLELLGSFAAKFVRHRTG